MRSEAPPNQAAESPAASGKKVVTRSYVLQIPNSGSENVRDQVRELIVESLPHETWTGRLGDGQAVTLSVIQDRVVVRHTPAVQEAVERILTDSGIASSSSAIAANSNNLGGGGGGFFRPNMGDSRYVPNWPRRVDPAPMAEDTSPEGTTIKAGPTSAADDPFAE
jgi:hypothetical protein